jgi:PKD repeat protein
VPTTGAVGGHHQYAEAGVYTVTVCVTDDDAGQGCDTVVVTVS